MSPEPASARPRPLRSLAFRLGGVGLAVSLTAACGGDSAGGDTGDSGALDGGSRDGGATGADGTNGAQEPCKSELNSPVRTGAATLSFGAILEMMPERRCETLRDASGAVVGWVATFGPLVAGAKPADQPYIKLLLAGSYTGDGRYGNTQENKPSGLQVGFRDSEGTGLVLGTATAQQTLVISDGGKQFVFDAAPYGEIAAVHLEGRCDPNDDTASTAGPAASMPTKGSVQLIDALGAVHVYDCLTCNYVAGKLSMRAPTVAAAGLFGEGLHTYFTLRASGSAGSFSIDNGEYAWQSPGVSVSGGGSSIDVSPAAPFSGQFSWNQSSTSGRQASGSFACPES